MLYVQKHYIAVIPLLGFNMPSKFFPKLTSRHIIECHVYIDSLRLHF